MQPMRLFRCYQDPSANSGRHKRSVWTIATSPFPGAHFATYPPALGERKQTAATQLPITSLFQRSTEYPKAAGPTSGPSTELV
jgi:hypothetical protein